MKDFIVMAQQFTTNFKDFDHKRLNFSEWDDNNDRSKGQKICYPRYESPTKGTEEPLFLQLPWMTIFKYGVPSIGEYYSNDKDRSFLKMPLDLSDPQVKQLFDELCLFDNKMSAKEMSESLFDKKAKKYTYIPSCKVVENESEPGVEQPPPYMKLKIHLSWPDENVETEVYRSETQEGTTKRKRTRLEVNTVQEFQDNVSYLSRVRLIIKPVKLWAQSSSLKDPNYGVTWRICKVEVEPKMSNTSLNQYKNNDAFIDSDDEDEPVSQQASKNDVAEDNASEDSESEESEDESESEEETAPPSPVLKKKAKGSKSKSKNS